MDYKEVRKYVELQRKQLEEFAALPVDLAVEALHDQSHEMRELFFIGIDNPPDIPMVDDPVLKALANLINDNLTVLNAFRRAKTKAKAGVCEYVPSGGKTCSYFDRVDLRSVASSQKISSDS